MTAALLRLQRCLDLTRGADFLAPLLLRLYLAPVLWMAGWNKLQGFESTVAWFGNPDWGLGLPLPWLMAALATSAELGGAVLLVLGLAVRWIAVPLMVTMLVAIWAVHWDNGWLAIAESSGLFATERTMMAAERLATARALLREHGDYAALTEFGSLVVLNNGIEFAATYFAMLLSLFFTGAGRYVSVDYLIHRRLSRVVRSEVSDPAAPRARIRVQDVQTARMG
jgi:putative oxidoreductase